MINAYLSQLEKLTTEKQILHLSLETPGQQAEYCIWLQDPQHKTDMDLLQSVQRRAMKMIRGLKLFSYDKS